MRSRECVEFGTKYLTDCIRMQRVGFYKKLDWQTDKNLHMRMPTNCTSKWILKGLSNLQKSCHMAVLEYKISPWGKTSPTSRKTSFVKENNPLPNTLVFLKQIERYAIPRNNHVSFLTCIVMQKKFRSTYYAWLQKDYGPHCKILMI